MRAHASTAAFHFCDDDDDDAPTTHRRRINEIMDPNHIQRHQYNTNPDSSYGAVFQLDTLVDVIPGLVYPAWLEVCVCVCMCVYVCVNLCV